MSWNRKSCHWRFVHWGVTCPMSQAKMDNTPHLVYFVGQLERTKTERFHYQCHVDFDTALNRREVIRTLGLHPTTHYDIADHPGRSRSYCRKIRSRDPDELPRHFVKGNAGSDGASVAERPALPPDTYIDF